ncbi:MAG: sodium/solute symporter [Planctomycetes bacterium]|nr:sodium/solute symporter [Planctomycetota bacterium]
MTNFLGPVDYLVVIAYLSATMVIGFWVGSYVRSGSDFFLAGRSLPWWAIGMSLVATDIGGTDLVGVGGDSYRYGLVMGNFEWIGCIPAMLVAAFVFIPHLWRCGVTTVPEYLERRFSNQLRTVVAACWLLLMACNLGVMLLAAAKFMHTLANWDMTVSILVTALLVGTYTWSGGLRAVVYTDLLQGIVMIGGCLLVLFIGIADLGGVEPFVDKVHDAVHARERRERLAADGVDSNATPTRRPKDQKSHHLSLVQPIDSSSPGPWPAILFGLALIVSPGYWIGNQCIVQRSLGAKSEYEAKASYVYGAVLKNMIPFLVAIPGLIAMVKFPNLGHEHADKALPLLVGSLLPEGLRGIFVAAFLAALMSSVDSYLNAATTIYVNDFYRRFYRPNADEGLMLEVGRWTTIGFVLWAVYFAFQLMSFGEGIYTIFQTLMSFVTGPTLAVILLGMLSSRNTAEGAVVGFIGGVMTSITLFLLNQQFIATWLGVHPLFRIGQAYLYYSIWAFLATVLLTWLFSYFAKPDAPEKRRYSLWEWKPLEEGTP